MGSAHHRRNASNRRNECNNRAVNTEGTPAKAGKFAKVAKPATACGEANYSRDTINIREDSSNRDNRNILDINSRLPESDRRKVNNGRDASNIQHQYQQHLQELTTKSL